MYLYVKALHIIFVVTWFAGLFYIGRLFIYHREAQDKNLSEKEILSRQYLIMTKRLWFGITWPSAILTLIFGSWMFLLFPGFPVWLMIKLSFVLGLFAYHFWLHAIYRQQSRERFRYTSQQLRMINEIPTVFLVAIVMLVVVKDSIGWIWGVLGLVALMIVLMAAIRIYKGTRNKNSNSPES